MEKVRILLGLKEPEEIGNRLVYVNDPPRNAHYSDNTVKNTKFTLTNFLPLMLADQFSQHMNRYFLLIACLQLDSTITPVNPWTTWTPLLVIFGVSMIKEAVDDWNRRKRDRLANSKRVTILRHGAQIEVASCEIRVGDLVRLQNNEEVPCDCVVLKSSAANGVCYVETANLDGETDLKERLAVQMTCPLSDSDLFRFKGVIECASPNGEIHKFDSTMKARENSSLAEAAPLSAKQLLLQGTKLRNTDWAWSVAVYTGNQTKIGKNKHIPTTKFTRADRFINYCTICIFMFQLACVIALGIIGNTWRSDQKPSAWYLAYWNTSGNAVEQSGLAGIVIPLRFLLLCSLMIPISIKVTLDVSKLAYAFFINWDRKMYCAQTDVPANAANTSISEDLGQIDFIFTDKTGTLTENLMVFKKCSVDGKVYGHTEPRGSLDDPSLARALEQGSDAAVHFARSILVNNAVVPAQSPTGGLEYRSPSPDEEALVKGLEKFKCLLTKRDASNRVDITISNRPESYEILQVLEFTSDRRRMSTVARNATTGELFLFTKGADDVLMTRKTPEQDSTALQKHLDLFGGSGLRTLAVACRRLDPTEYSQWAQELHSASTAVHGREEKVAIVYDRLEQNLVLLGATAIEDQLQDGVGETISSLRDAGIKFWMLTGDKLETAAQIATTCCLISPEPQGVLVMIRGRTLHEVKESMRTGLETARSTRKDATKKLYVLIEGTSLVHALSDDLLSEFVTLTYPAHSVICCRVTPSQKAQVVNVVRTHFGEYAKTHTFGFKRWISSLPLIRKSVARERCPTTLAIGDGGNDVAMIQQADVGVGLQGKEGLQAARAADYSLGRFKYLKRLVLVHGRMSVYRTSFIAQYCFYKSLLIAFVQLGYAYFTAFSGQTLLNSFSLSTYNILFTALPPVFFVLDKDVSERACEKYPLLYAESQKNRFMNPRTFLRWFSIALFQAIMLALFLYRSFWDFCGQENGRCINNQTLGIVFFTAIIVIQTLVMLLESKYLTFWNHFAIWGSLIAYVVASTAMSNITTSSMFDLMSELASTEAFYATLFLISLLCILPFVLYRYVSFNYFPSLSDLVRFKENSVSPSLHSVDQLSDDEGHTDLAD